MLHSAARRRAAFASLAVCALAPVGCGATRERTATSSAAAIGVNGRPIGKLSTPGVPKGEQTVSIQVIARTGAQRSALALVPVYIDEHGPYPFALDTGASTSLISSALAHKFHLPEVGAPQVVSGVTGTGRAVNVRVGNWRAGKVPLPQTLLAAMLPSAQGATKAPPRSQGRRVGAPVGLLGSDVLSRYGKIAVDYDRSLLILDPPVR
jgi:aspartyl protease